MSIKFSKLCIESQYDKLYMGFLNFNYKERDVSIEIMERVPQILVTQ